MTSRPGLPDATACWQDRTAVRLWGGARAPEGAGEPGLTSRPGLPDDTACREDRTAVTVRRPEAKGAWVPPTRPLWLGALGSR